MGIGLVIRIVVSWSGALFRRPELASGASLLFLPRLFDPAANDNFSENTSSSTGAGGEWRQLTEPASEQRQQFNHRQAHLDNRLLRNVKNGKVVVLLNGRFAGRKAIVVKAYDEGHGDRKFAHAIVAGIDRYPRKVTRAMGKNKLKKRSKVKPFVKYVNYNHIMPTRYVADIDLKKVLDDEVLANPESRVESRKTIKKVFEERYLNQAACKSEKKAAGVSFFFKKLRF